MRRILLPFVLACAVAGLVTASNSVHTPTPAEAAPQLLTAPAAVDTQAPAPTVEPSVTASVSAPPSASAPPVSAHTTLTSAPPAATKTSQQIQAQTRNEAEQLPLPYSGSAGQVITVVAAAKTATTATLNAWTRVEGGWRRDLGPVTANVGSMGVGQASETTSRTPAGVHSLTEAFGIAANNGTKLPYFQVDDSDWWVSDSASPAYNTHVRCAPGACTFNEQAGEHLLAAGSVYNHAVVINYNRSPVQAGAGSAFFLHVSNGKATAGCVSVPSAQLDAIMRWLDPAQHPVVNIG